MAIVGAGGVAGTKVGAAGAGSETGSGGAPKSALSLAAPKSAVWFCPSCSLRVRLVSR